MVYRSGGVEAMAAKLEEIRLAAARVAASRGLDLVEIELVGPSKERVLRVFLEKNTEGRAKLKAAKLEEIAGDKEAAGAAIKDLPERFVKEVREGTLSLEQF